MRCQIDLPSLEQVYYTETRHVDAIVGFGTVNWSTGNGLFDVASFYLYYKQIFPLPK